MTTKPTFNPLRNPRRTTTLRQSIGEKAACVCCSSKAKKMNHSSCAC